MSGSAATSERSARHSSNQVVTDPLPTAAAKEHLLATKSQTGDWREATLERIRSLIREAEPDMVEEHKWKKPSNGMVGVPVWSHNGIVCTGETYKNTVKVTFAKGALVDDPSGLFNASLDGNLRRAIDFHEGDSIDGKALKALVKAAVKLNAEKGS